MNLRDKLFSKNKATFRIAYDAPEMIRTLASTMQAYLPTHRKRPLVVVCIGTDRSTGDALGPLVGTKLQEKAHHDIHVFGTLDEPVHAVNLNDYIQHIKQTYHRPFIIAIDACLGELKSVGDITLHDGPVRPGLGVNKELTPVGHIHLNGIVNVSGFMEYFVLQNTRLSFVMKMADAIALSLHQAIVMFTKKEETSLPREKFPLPFKSDSCMD